MNSQRLENLGLLQTKKQHAQVLVLKLKSLRESIHRAANPYKPLADLDPEVLMVAAKDLWETWDQYQRLVKELRALCAELGEPVPVFE